MFQTGMVSGKANCSQVFSDPVDCFEPWEVLRERGCVDIESMWRAMLLWDSESV